MSETAALEEQLPQSEQQNIDNTSHRFKKSHRHRHHRHYLAMDPVTGLHLDRYGRAQDKAYSQDIRDYELLTAVGSDDSAFVYLTRYLPTGSLVCLRYTDLTMAPDFEFLEELWTNIRVTRQCQHPAILHYHTSFVENERLWTVTEVTQLGSCGALIRDHFPNGFPEPVVLHVLKEVIRALIYLHERQHLIHTNVRADHILLDAEGHVRLTGLYGAVSMVARGAYKKQTFSPFVALPSWSAPELIGQDRPFDYRVDIYSLGITAIELAFGHTPYDGWPPLKILYQKISGDYSTQIPVTSAHSRALRQFILSCLQKNPEKRPTLRSLLKHPCFAKSKGGRVYLEQNLTRSLAMQLERLVPLMPPRPRASTTSNAEGDSAAVNADEDDCWL